MYFSYQLMHFPVEDAWRANAAEANGRTNTPRSDRSRSPAGSISPPRRRAGCSSAACLGSSFAKLRVRREDGLVCQHGRENALFLNFPRRTSPKLNEYSVIDEVIPSCNDGRMCSANMRLQKTRAQDNMSFEVVYLWSNRNSIHLGERFEMNLRCLQSAFT